jgi:ribonuclease P protein component
VLGEARRVYSPNFFAWARVNDLTYARLGLIAGRKAAPRAVDRNRGKRLIREWFRAVRAELPGLDIVVQLRTSLLDVDNAALRAELEQLQSRLRKAAQRQPHGQQ